MESPLSFVLVVAFLDPQVLLGIILFLVFLAIPVSRIGVMRRYRDNAAIAYSFANLSAIVVYFILSGGSVKGTNTVLYCEITGFASAVGYMVYAEELRDPAGLLRAAFWCFLWTMNAAWVVNFLSAFSFGT